MPGTSSPKLLLVGEARTAQDRADIRAFVAAFPACPVVLKSAMRRRDLRFKGRATSVYREDWTDPKPGAAALADRLIAEHRPAWVIAYGLDTDHLVAALERRGVATAVYIDKGPNDDAFDARIYNTTRNAAAIVFRDQVVADAFPANTWSLAARDCTIVGVALPAPAASKSVVSRLAAMLAGPEPADFSAVVPTLSGLARDAAQIAERSRRDHAAILESGRFDAELFLGADASAATPDEAVRAYLHASRLLIPRDRLLAGRLLRRPAAGFNPLIYATEAPGFDEASGEDPLAHFLRSGAPDGRWLHPVLTPTASTAPATERVALHGHFHYTDLFPDFLARLHGQNNVDLFLTTSSDESVRTLQDALAQEGAAAVSLTKVPNRGRDLGPFFDLFEAGAFDAYPIVGHVHGKKSLFYDKGELWRDFVWEHIIGGRHKMIDVVRAAFAADPKLGLVYPEDPHLEGWEQNFERAGHLLARMGRSAPPPTHLDYPMGSMFWARPTALTPFLKLDLARNYPDEPLPNDGTILHTLERLFVFAAEITGFHYAATRVPGSVR